MNITIIGAGLAGTSCAHTLKRYASNVKIIEASNHLASGASGNIAGLVNPRLSAFRTPESDYFTSALSMATREFNKAGEAIDWQQCGALHFLNDEKKQKRFAQTLDNWDWPAEAMRLVTREEACTLSGIDVSLPALYLPYSGCVSPKKLCTYYAKNIQTTFGETVETLSDIDADIIILACGVAVKSFPEAAFLPLGTVRGQVTHFQSAALSGLRTNLCYGGYCAPADSNSIHTAGATFQRWLEDCTIRPEDDTDNLKKLGAILPKNIADDITVTGHRASLRTTSKDHFPIVGRLPGHDNIYVSTGHGSHGILSALAGARLLTDLIMGTPLSQSIHTFHALSPNRFMPI